MDDLSQLVLKVASIDPGLVSGPAVPGAAARAKIRYQVAFVPTPDMSAYDLAGIMGVVLNVMARREPVSPEEMEALPPHLKPYFRAVSPC